MAKEIIHFSCYFGCDPELFLENEKGQIVGSERIVPVGGAGRHLDEGKVYGSLGGHIVRDGVQIELNPTPNTCRAILSNTLQASFRTLNGQLKKAGGNYKASFASVVTVQKKELDALSEASRVLGCAPSKNLYDKDATVKINHTTLRKRSAGGHIHIGVEGRMRTSIQKDPDRFAKIMDVLVGNTCVMVDRDPLARARRRVYGRAGEYRVPIHGFEYRTLSNFWLRSYPLMSMVMGLTRIAVSVHGTTIDGSGYSNDKYKWDAEASLLENINFKKIQKAINLNELELAKENWTHVRKFILDSVPYLGDGCAVCKTSMKEFEFFLKKIESDGIEYWFKDDPFTHWLNKPEGHQRGFESWLNRTVKKEMLEAEFAAKKETRHAVPLSI